MGLKRSAGVACVAALALGTQAMAASRCARPDEMTAIQAAMIQQELMVAALTCNQIEHFNAFQTNFGPELRASDGRLARMFMRLYGARRGEAEYHAFKTRLANHSSIRSIHDNAGYCQEASTVFDAALTTQKPSLSSFVAGVQVVETSPVNSCQLRVQVGLAGKVVPDVVPQPNPERIATVTPQ
ncbi:MAG TPA: hypothetical protein VHU23_17565 [Rhizomicrobium sp.]|jgi:hypothetical protein|nr:hypothetical protein [Rhizomicrobium sp.]